MSPEQPSPADRPSPDDRRGGRRTNPSERHREGRRPRGWWAQIAEAGDTARQPARLVDASKSRRDLYAEAQQLGIEGRSAMNKQQLVEALQRHYATGGSAAPTTPGAPSTGRPFEVERQVRSAPSPAPVKTDSGRRRRQAAPEPERCVIRYQGSNRSGEFRVIVTEADGASRTVARSPAFPAEGREAPRDGAARAAHDLLVQRLGVSGWWPAGSAKAWPELEFIRVRPGDSDDVRSFVTVVREAGRARFVAEQLDGYGNPTPLVASESFRAPRLLPVRPSRPAKEALDGLLLRLEADGWRFGEDVEGEWYSISLLRGPQQDEDPLRAGTPREPFHGS